ERGRRVDNAELLKELRIGRHQREDHGGAGGRWPWIVGALVVVLLLLGAAGWFWLGQRALPVQVAQAVSLSADSEAGAVLQATGYVTARRQATVSAQITGTLTAVLIEEGDHVIKGQVLARLDDSAYRAGLQTARAQAAAAQALVAQYRAQLAQNRHDSARLQSLAQQGLVSKQAAEQARTLVDSTRAQLAAQQKQSAAAAAQAVQAEVNFDYTVVRAPFSGVGTIVDMDSLEVDVDVNEAYIGRVKPDMPAEAVLDAYPDWKIPAHVIAIV